jgi:hypothetical protein
MQEEIATAANFVVCTWDFTAYLLQGWITGNFPVARSKAGGVSE